MKLPKYRIKRVEYNSGIVNYIPQKREPKNPPELYLMLIPFLPIVTAVLLVRCFDYGVQVFSPYKWVSIDSEYLEKLNIEGWSCKQTAQKSIEDDKKKVIVGFEVKEFNNEMKRLKQVKQTSYIKA